MKRVRVTIVASAESSFVQTDRSLLAERFDVRYVSWKGKRSVPNLAWAIFRTDAVFSWFALDHAYVACRLAKLLGRKSLAFVGGADAARRPDLNYGAHLNPPMSRRSRIAIAQSDRVMVVDDHLRDEIERNTGIRRGDIRTIHLGFDAQRFCPDGGPRVNILTVGIVDDVNIRRKGLDVFAEAARRLPDIPFVLVGGRPNAATERLRSNAPSNLRVLGRLSESDLLEQFRRARVYAQLSRYEAFGSALGEAMACGCIPVGTDVGGIATLVDGTGFLVPVGDVDATVAAIRNASTKEDGTLARDRIKQHFSLERREAGLVDVIHGLFEA